MEITNTDDRGKTLKKVPGKSSRGIFRFPKHDTQPQKMTAISPIHILEK